MSVIENLFSRENFEYSTSSIFFMILENMYILFGLFGLFGLTVVLFSQSVLIKRMGSTFVVLSSK